jgi:hypothetical protein
VALDLLLQQEETAQMALLLAAAPAVHLDHNLALPVKPLVLMEQAVVAVIILQPAEMAATVNIF